MFLKNIDLLQNLPRNVPT